MTKRLMVGDVAVGGGAPVSIQSMCNTKTDDVRATVEQIHALEAAGCEIIRIAIPDQAAAEAVDRIKEQISIPLIADIHFNYKYALACAERGIDAIRINPGNIGRATPPSCPIAFSTASWIPATSSARPMADLWKMTCGPNTAASRQRHWWRAPWATWPF